MVLTPVAGIPVACVVAVLKYRLYDLGRIVSRTVSYAIVTGLLVGVYAGLVLLATEVIGLKSPVAVAVATLAAAALFGPLRSRVQRRVDHRFNRARYDAERMLAAFAARLKEELDADAVTRGPGPFGPHRPGTRPRLDLAGRTLTATMSGRPAARRPRRQHWLSALLADWPAEERCDFARLISRFAGDIHRHLDELDV